MREKVLFLDFAHILISRTKEKKKKIL
jgi:hypothetical protein